MIFDFTRCGKSIHFRGLRLNENGIPEIVGFREHGFITTEVTASQYGIYRWQLYEKTGDKEHLSAAMRCAEWLDVNSDRDKNWVVWPYEFKNKFMGIKPPWLCGLGQALSAWLLFKLREANEQWEELAYGALEPLFHSVNQGGLSNSIDDYKFFEEYPSEPPSATLNGFIYILLVLHAFFESGYNRVGEYFSNYSRSLAENIYRYDTDYWTLYDLWKYRRLASPEYHWIHTYQVNLLYEITGFEIFRKYYLKWDNYLNSTNSRFVRTIAKTGEKLRIFFDISGGTK